MIFHENRLLADDSHVISYLIFCRKLRKMSQNLSSAAVVIGALRVNSLHVRYFFQINLFQKNSFRNTTRVSNGLDPDQDRRYVGPDLGPNSLPKDISNSRR